MNTKYIFIIFSIVGFFPIAGYSQNGDPVPTYAGGAVKEKDGTLLGVEKLSLDEIKNKILTNLFFRGEVADGFIDAKLYGEILGDVSGKSFSKVREKLIIWIYNNPDKAAEMYFNIYGQKFDKKPGKIKYNDLKGKISPHFLKLIKNLEASAKNLSLDDESLTMAGRRLFEGFIAKTDYANVDLPSFKPLREKGPREEFDFADFKLNQGLLERETKGISSWVLALKKNVEEKIYQEKISPGYDRERIRSLYVRTFRLYKTFIVRVSSLKGRANITAQESLRLERERLVLRRSLTSLQLLMEHGRLNAQTKTFNEKYPEFSFLDRGAKKILEEILNQLDQIEKGSVGLKELNLRANNTFSLIKNSTLKNNFYLWLFAFKKAGDDIKFSCASDFLVFSYLKTLNPLSRYVALKDQIQKDSSQLEQLLLKIKNGGEDEVFALMLDKSEAGGDIIGMLERMSSSLKSIAEYSAANKRVQRIVFDMVFNPFNIYMDSTGRMKIKINYFIAGFL
ncbi:MAG: hypothetical protein U9Q34_01350 [Elusimicrobiota bacterium]|nr:hypothetical protein [Elusimicrobiota bacterium]